MNARDRMICELAIEGKTNMEIGDALGVGHSTVAKRLRLIYKELGIVSPEFGGPGGKSRRKLKAALAQKPRVEI